MTKPMTWQEARDSELAGMECLWQDLDGVHLEPAPHDPPRSSILWAWSSAGEPPRAVRCRLDGDMVLLAQTDSTGGESLVLWGNHDRVRQVRAAGTSDVLTVRLIQVQESVSADGRVPLSFLYRDHR